MGRTIIFTLALLAAGTANAQNVIVPSGPYITDTGCLVKGLNPNGDGFLALRTGPGTNHSKIGELRNGDAAYIRKCQGKWCYVENGSRNGREARFSGWIYDKWCEFYP